MIDENKLIQIRNTVYQTMPNKLYHNFLHAVDVEEVAKQLCEMEKVSLEKTYLVRSGAWLHDIIPTSEELSAKFSEEYLQKLGYSSIQIDIVSDMILATKYPTKPQGILQKIICDADTANVGRSDCFEKGKLVFMEMGIPTEKWNSVQETFLVGHQFYTDSAKQLYQKGKEENIGLLKKIQ